MINKHLANHENIQNLETLMRKCNKIIDLYRKIKYKLKAVGNMGLITLGKGYTKKRMLQGKPIDQR